MPDRLAIIANPTAGASALASAVSAVRAASTQRRILAAASREFRSQGVALDLHLETEPHAVEARAFRAACDGASTLVAAGGDGTVNAVVNGMMRARAFSGVMPALGVLPMGTGNVFAFNLGIPREWRKACRVIRDGNTRTIDVGKAVSGSELRVSSSKKPNAKTASSAQDAGIETRHFLLMAGIGYDAKVIEETSLRMKYVLRDFAYVIKTLENVVRHQGTQMTLHFSDDKFYANVAWLVMVGNAASYAWNIKVTPHAQLDDGLLDVCLMPFENNLVSLQQAIQILTGQHIERGSAQYWRVESLRVESSPNVPIQLDGDEWHNTPVELSVLPAALRVLAPEQAI
jgi:diacylglycerol kinase (ATP)